MTWHDMLCHVTSFHVIMSCYGLSWSNLTGLTALFDSATVTFTLNQLTKSVDRLELIIVLGRSMIYKCFHKWEPGIPYVLRNREEEYVIEYVLTRRLSTHFDTSSARIIYLPDNKSPNSLVTKVGNTEQSLIAGSLSTYIMSSHVYNRQFLLTIDALQMRIRRQRKIKWNLVRRRYKLYYANMYSVVYTGIRRGWRSSEITIQITPIKQLFTTPLKAQL